MKTLQEIKNTGEDLDNILEFKDKSLTDPPMILLLKRKAIRLFPSGAKVALYHSDKLGIDVSIPYVQNKEKDKEVAGLTAEETLTEEAHDAMFGEYIAVLQKHYETGSKHTDHPELSKLKHKIINKYGKEAHHNFHSAAEHYLNGNYAKAARHYMKFEKKIDENFEEFVDKKYLEEGAIHKLHQIVSSKQGGTVNFKNGATARVEFPQAAHIMKLYSQLTPENKAKIEKLVNDSPAGLSKVADFAADNLK
jgi:hypothetical protein